MLKGKARSRSWLASKVELWREAVHESQCIPEAVVEAFTHALLVVSSLLLSGVGQYRRCVCECKSSNEVKWLFVAYREPLQPHLPISKFPVWNLELWQITPGNNLAQAEGQSAHSLGRLLAGICASLLNSRLQHKQSIIAFKKSRAVWSTCIYGDNTFDTMRRNCIISVTIEMHTSVPLVYTGTKPIGRTCSAK